MGTLKAFEKKVIAIMNISQFIRLAVCCLLLALGPLGYAQENTSQDDPIMEGEALDTVTISDEEAKEILNGLFNVKRVAHALQARNTMKDESLESLMDDFTESTGVNVVSFPYITGDSFWSKRFRQWAESKYQTQKNSSSSYLSNKVIFSAPANSPPGNYSVGVELSSKAAEEGNPDEVNDFETLNQMLNYRYLQGKTYERPKDSRTDLFRLYENAFGQIPGLMAIDEPDGSENSDTIFVDWRVDTLFVSSSTTILAVGAQPETSIGSTPSVGVVVVKDSEGNIWVVDSEGNVTKGGGISDGETTIPTDSAATDSTAAELIAGSGLIKIQDKDYEDGKRVYLKKEGTFSFSLENAESDSIQWAIFNQEAEDISNFETEVDFSNETLSLPSGSVYHYVKVRAIYNGYKTDLNVFAFELKDFEWSKDELTHGKKDSVKLDYHTNIEDKANIELTLITGKDTLNYPFDENTYWYNYKSDDIFYDPKEYDVKIQVTYQDQQLVNISKKIKVASDYVVVVKDTITSAAEKAVDYGDDFVGNSTWAACNICTRAALYISTGEGDDVLFPKGGSRIGNSTSTYLKGDINDPGKANNIYDDLKDGLVAKFEYISDKDNEDYPDFEQLQDDVNDGQIIVGTYYNSSGSGHVVMIVPGTASEHDDEKKFVLSDNVTQIKLPKILECGSNHRESATRIDDNMSENTVKSLRWYKLKIIE